MTEPEDATVWKDPIVEEVRRIRAAMAEEFGSMEELFRELRRAQERETGRVILDPPGSESPHAPAH